MHKKELRNLVKILNPFEYKETWKWYPRKFSITVADSSIYLYNQDQKLITASPYLCKFDELDTTEFQCQCVYSLTNLNFDTIKREVKKRHAIKRAIWNLYHVPIENPDFYKKHFRWIKLRNTLKFELALQPNWNGIYFAQIFNKRKSIQFLNNNPLELCLDIFICIESIIGKEEVPYTFSQAWYKDWKIYGHRKFPHAIARYNIEQSYCEYPFKELIRIFKNSDRTIFKDAIQVFQRLRKENKYYIMQTIINDKHFQINEDGFIIYYPVRQEEMKLI